MRKQLITGKIIVGKDSRWAKGHMQCFFKHSWSVLKSSKLNLKEKVDALLLLNVYFMPILAFLSMLTGLLLIFFVFPVRWRFMDICSHLPV